MAESSLPTSTCRSGAPGSLWWKERGGIDVVYTQWPTLVRKFQERAKTLLPATFGLNGYNRSNLATDGVYGEQTGRALGAALYLSGMRDVYALQQQEWPDHIVTLGTIEGLVFFGLHASRVGNNAVQAADGITFSRADIDIPADVALPDWNMRVLELAADKGWVGRAPAGAPRPRSPSELAAAGRNGQVTGGGSTSVPTPPPNATTSTPGTATTPTGSGRDLRTVPGGSTVSVFDQNAQAPASALPMPAWKKFAWGGAALLVVGVGGYEYYRHGAPPWLGGRPKRR